jgi:hypothetical protein
MWGDRVVSVYTTQEQAQETIQPPPKPGLRIGLAPLSVVASPLIFVAWKSS